MDFKKIIGMFLAFALPLSGIAAIIYLVVVTPRNRAFIDREFFTPYVELLSTGRYADAWALHSESYRRRNPLEKFAAHYEKIIDENGRITGHTLPVVHTTFNPFKKVQDFSVHCVLLFADTGIRISYGLGWEKEQRWVIETAGAVTPSYRHRGDPW